MENSESAQLFLATKAILKERKITYRDIAKRLGKSESSVKRIFSIEDCSLSSLLELLSTIDLTLSDLMEYARDKKVEAVEFSAEAEEFLAGSLDYFFIYRKLAHHLNAEEVRKRENISSAKMTKYLKKLDELKIINWLPGDKIQVLHGEFIKFRADGPLKQAVYKAWAPKLHEIVLNNMGDGKHTLRLISARCTPQLQEDFREEFEELIERFVKRASLETKTKPTQVHSVAISLALGPLRIGLDRSDLI